MPALSPAGCAAPRLHARARGSAATCSAPPLPGPAPPAPDPSSNFISSRYAINFASYARSSGAGGWDPPPRRGRSPTPPSASRCRAARLGLAGRASPAPRRRPPLAGTRACPARPLGPLSPGSCGATEDSAAPARGGRKVPATWWSLGRGLQHPPVCRLVFFKGRISKMTSLWFAYPCRPADELCGYPVLLTTRMDTLYNG